MKYVIKNKRVQHFKSSLTSTVIKLSYYQNNVRVAISLKIENLFFLLSAFFLDSCRSMNSTKLCANYAIAPGTWISFENFWKNASIIKKTFFIKNMIQITVQTRSELKNQCFCVTNSIFKSKIYWKFEVLKIESFLLNGQIFVLKGPLHSRIDFNEMSHVLSAGWLERNCVVKQKWLITTVRWRTLHFAHILQDI